MTTSLFCTDEDIATRFRGDFLVLCDREYLAQGSDGAFPAGGSWAMTSAANAFDAQGVAAGSVVALRAPATAFGSAGQLLAVASASGHSATMRKLNLEAGQGVPPGPAAGLTGISFVVPTLRAQVENATYDLDRRFGVSAFITGRRVSDMWDPREVRDACVLTVASRRFFDLARQGEKGGDIYLEKAIQCKQELTDLLDRVTVHWANTPEPARETGRFSTRIVR